MRPSSLREALYHQRARLLPRQASWLYEDEACVQDCLRHFGYPLPRGAPVAEDYATAMDWLRATPLLRALARQISLRLWLHLALRPWQPSRVARLGCRV